MPATAWGSEQDKKRPQQRVVGGRGRPERQCANHDARPARASSSSGGWRRRQMRRQGKAAGAGATGAPRRAGPEHLEPLTRGPRAGRLCVPGRPRTNDVALTVIWCSSDPSDGVAVARGRRDLVALLVTVPEGCLTRSAASSGIRCLHDFNTPLTSSGMESGSPSPFLLAESVTINVVTKI
jgi:hypothetical protein